METEQKSEDIEYKNLGEAVEKQRLRDIFDTREKVREARDKALSAGHSSQTEIHIRRAKAMYRTAVETYISEVEPIFRRTDEGPGIFEEAPIGAITAEPPMRESTGRAIAEYEVKVKNSGRGDWRGVAKNDVPDPKSIEVQGVGGLLDLPSPIRFTWDVELTADPVIGSETVTIEKEVEPDFLLLDRAFRIVNEHIAEVGFELEISEEQQTHIDKDLVEDVDEWRRNNL